MPESKADVVDLSAHEVLTRLGQEMEKWNGWGINLRKLLHAVHHLSKEQVEGLSYGSFGVQPIPMRGILNTNKPPSPPSRSARSGMMDIHRHDKGVGKVTVEKNLKDELYVDGRKVTLYRSVEQEPIFSSVYSRVLYEELRAKGKLLANACIYDFLMANPGFIPESWKALGDKSEKVGYVLFLGTLFMENYEHARTLFFKDGSWQTYLHSFERHVSHAGFVAILEN